MSDLVYHGFLHRQLEEGTAIEAASNILRLRRLGQQLPQRYLAEFRCRGLVQSRGGQITTVERCLVGVYFPPDYLRRAEVPEVVTWLEPRNVFHPNILAPYICIGRLEPATSLVDILYQVFEIFVYRKFTPRENDSLNRFACAWARNNQHRFPTDTRPLKRLGEATPQPGAHPGGAA